MAFCILGFHRSHLSLPLPHRVICPFDISEPAVYRNWRCTYIRLKSLQFPRFLDYVNLNILIATMINLIFFFHRTINQTRKRSLSLNRYDFSTYCKAILHAAGKENFYHPRDTQLYPTERIPQPQRCILNRPPFVQLEIRKNLPLIQATHSQAHFPQKGKANTPSKVSEKSANPINQKPNPVKLVSESRLRDLPPL